MSERPFSAPASSPASFEILSQNISMYGQSVLFPKPFVDTGQPVKAPFGTTFPTPISPISPFGVLLFLHWLRRIFQDFITVHCIVQYLSISHRNPLTECGPHLL